MVEFAVWGRFSPKRVCVSMRERESELVHYLFLTCNKNVILTVNGQIHGSQVNQWLPLVFSVYQLLGSNVGTTFPLPIPLVGHCQSYAPFGWHKSPVPVQEWHKHALTLSCAK